MIRRLVAILSGLLLLGLVVTPSASAGEPSISFWFHGTARVSADGSTLSLTFDYRCPRKYGGQRGYGILSSTQITERLGGGLSAFGTDTDGQGVDLVCDGHWRHGHHTVTTLDLAYRPGTAFLAGALLFCDAAELNCVDLTKKRTVVILGP